MLRDEEGSTVSQQDVSHGSEPGKAHSRARLRDLGRTWLRARPSRSALACGRTGRLGGINGGARRQTSSEKEAPLACTFEDRRKACAGWLTPHFTPEMPAPVRRQSAR